MNKKINKEEFEKVLRKQLCTFTVGSRLYGTAEKDSDFDYVMLVSEESGLSDKFTYQFKEDSADWLICTPARFEEARRDGSDVVLYEAKPIRPTYRIIRAYLGLAKRDLKEFEKTGSTTKKYHAARCWLIARNLMETERPMLETAAFEAQKMLWGVGAKTMGDLIKQSRDKLNRWFDQKLIDE